MGKIIRVSAMEEGEYRETYHEVNPLRCQFEKSILSRQTMCEHAHRFCLADREGVACLQADAQAQCRILIDKLRDKAAFALKLTKIDGPLPHAKEVKVQTGGILGLQRLLANEMPANQDSPLHNIHALIEQAKAKYGDLASLPFDEIAREIVQYEGRNRRTRKQNK